MTLTAGDENEYRLVRDLLVSYDKRVRPSIHYTKSVNITYGVALSQIIDVVRLSFLFMQISKWILDNRDQIVGQYIHTNKLVTYIVKLPYFLSDSYFFL